MSLDRSSLVRAGLRTVGALLVIYALWSWLTGLLLWRALKHEQTRMPADQVNRILGRPLDAPADDARPHLMRAMSRVDTPPIRELHQALLARLSQRERADLNDARLSDAGLMERLATPDAEAWLDEFRAAARAGRCAGWLSCPPLPVGIGVEALGLNARRLAEQAAWEPALRDALAALALAETLAPEPMPPHQLMRADSLGRAVALLNRLLILAPPDRFPEAVLAEMDARLASARADVTPVLARALEADRRLPPGAGAVFERALAGRLSRAELNALGLSRGERLLFTRPFRPRLRLAFIRYLKAIERQRDWSLLPAGDALARSSAKPPAQRGLARRAIPDFTVLARADANRRVMTDLAWIGVRLVRHARREGRFPATLGEALPADTPLPRDPYSGRPYLYRGTRDVVLLSSVGPDGRDEGDRRPDEARRSDDLRWVLRIAPAHP